MADPLFDYQGGRYHEYAQDDEYEFQDGLVVVPLAKPATAPPPHFLVVRRHAPVGYRRHRVAAAKSGTPPVLPTFADTPSGDLLLSARVSVESPESRGPDETVRTFAAQGNYLYVQGGAVDTLALVPAGTTAKPSYLDRRHVPVYTTGTTPTGAAAVNPRLDTGRPPFVRIAVDGRLALWARVIGGIPLIGGVLIRMLAGPLLDSALNLADRTVAVPNLQGDHTDYAVAYRPNYLSDGIIR